MDWNTPGIFIGGLLFIGGYVLGRMSKAFETMRESRLRWTPNLTIDDADIETAVRARKKVEAIKLYRQRTGTDLKEAKQAIETLAQRINILL